MRSHAKAASVGSISSRAGGRVSSVRGAFAGRGAFRGANGSGAPSGRGRTHLASLALALAIAAFALFAPSASASKGIVNTLGAASGKTGGLFNQPRGLAVNNTGNGGVPAGTFYVVDTNNRRIQRFAPDGSFVAAWGWDVNSPDGDAAYEICTVAANCLQADAGAAAGQFGSPIAGQGVAIDQATGVVYVSDQINRRIDAFSATGAFQGAFGFGVVAGDVAPFSLDFCTTLSGCQRGETGAEAGELSSGLGGVAVNAAHEIFVADKTNSRIAVFSPTFNGSDEVNGVSFARAFGWKVNQEAPVEAFQVCTTASGCQAGSSGTGAGQFAEISPVALALDSLGNLYALDAPNRRVEKFDLSSPASPSPIGSPAFDPSIAISSTFGTGSLYGIAVDQETDHLFLLGSDSASTPTAEQVRVAELSSTGTAIDTHGADLTIITAVSLAVAPPSLGGNIYLSSINGGQRVFVLNAPPAATLDDVTVFDQTTATFSGTADPTGASVTCTFQYSLNGIDWTDLAEPDCASLDPSGGPQAVSQDVSGLEPATLYRVRLRVVKAGGAGTVTTLPKLFTTDSAPPLLSATSVDAIGDTTATFRAQVNARNQPTTYHFEYTTEADFLADVGGGGDGFAGATSVPVPDASAGSGTGNVAVLRAITGLQSGTAYRFRAVATNSAGTTEGPDVAFSTYPAAPVSSPCANDSFRNGPSAALPECRAYEQATPLDKNGQEIRGLTDHMAASSDGSSIMYFTLNGMGGSPGPNGNPHYLATRGGGAWSSQGLLAPISYGEKSRVVGWLPDLSTVFTSASSVTTGGQHNLLALDPATSVFTTISDAGFGAFVGASADGRIAYFQSAGTDSEPLPSPEGVPGKPNLYAWDRDSGAVVLAGVLPDSACVTPPCLPSGGSVVKGDDVRDGGYPIASHAVTASGGAYFTDAATGQLYLRRDPFGTPSTVHVSASHRTVPSALHPADFQLATPDGAHAFFTSTSELTDDANTGPDEDPPAIGRVDLPDPLASPPCDTEPCNLDKSNPLLPGTAPAAMDADAEHLYWIEQSGSAIGRSNLDGTSVEHEFITGLANAKDLVVDSTRQQIYWTNAATDFNPEDGTIGRADLSINPGDPATNVNQSCISGFRSPRGIDVSESFGVVYWVYDVHGGSSLARADISGSCTTANTGKQLGLGVAQNVDDFADVALTDDYVFISNYNAFFNSVQIQQLNIADLSAAGFFSFGVAGPTETPLAVDGSHLYYGNSRTGAIGRADFGFSNRNDSFITGLTAPVGLALGLGADAGHLYWATGISAAGRTRDLYRYDAATDSLTDLTPDSLGADVRGVLGASDDGDYVYFVANADLDGALGEATPGDCTAPSELDTGEPTFGHFHGECSIYYWHAGDPHPTFVARLDASNGHSGQSDVANWISAGQAFGSEKVARVSADGQTLLFRSDSPLTGYDNVDPTGACGGFNASQNPIIAPCPELYRFHVGQGLACVSCNPTGAPPIGPPTLARIDEQNPYPAEVVQSLTRNLSPDGDRVFFETPDKLVAADVNGDGGDCGVPTNFLGRRAGYQPCLDVYEWEAPGAGQCEASVPEFAPAAGGCLYLISTGKSPEPSFFLDASASGDDAFFFTREQLLPSDTDALRDAYDARVGGGLAAQHATTPPLCQADACRGSASSPSGAPGAASAAFSGQGNPKPNRCPRGKVRRKGRCVSARHKKRKQGTKKRHHRRTANHNRRASR